MSTNDLRAAYLVDDLFRVDEFRAVYTHHDRIVMAGAMPVEGPVELPALDELRTPAFLTGREAGVINVGGSGTVEVDGEVFTVGHAECVYIGRGAEVVRFRSETAGDPARFYVFSAPAQSNHPTRFASRADGASQGLGDPLQSNVRTLTRYIHEEGIQSSQIVMGVTTLEPGNLWNTMPAHTHDRRTECYLYFDLPEEQRIIHLLGERDQTRHLVVANSQGIISPSWSIHSGVGTSSYSFVWAMAGENKEFADMDAAPVGELR
jgi:4-deoxy-L-threo-5-hexosulose-uronate ketol-isomerase